MSRDCGHKRAGPQVRSPQWSDPNSGVELTRLALDVGEIEIKNSKMTQDLWLELPFTEMGLRAGPCAPVGVGGWESSFEGVGLSMSSKPELGIARRGQ